MLEELEHRDKEIMVVLPQFLAVQVAHLLILLVVAVVLLPLVVREQQVAQQDRVVLVQILIPLG
jgi:hypothetical protein